jgi:hypothetical protein
VLAGLRGEESIAELCRREASALKEVVAELTLENRLLSTPAEISPKASK